MAAPFKDHESGWNLNLVVDQATLYLNILGYGKGDAKILGLSLIEEDPAILGLRVDSNDNNRLRAIFLFPLSNCCLARLEF